MGSNDSRRSRNLGDDRSAGVRRAAGIGILAVVLVAAGRFMGIHPVALFHALADDASVPSSPVGPAAVPTPESGSHQAEFARAVLGETTAVWAAYFKQLGRVYVAPQLVLYRGAAPTACGFGRPAAGPFYCARTREVYIDLAFFHQLATDFGAPGAFGQIYVIAHEVGHHVQNLLGITAAAARASQGVAPAAAAHVGVELELQADCFAGVWAARANAAHRILGVDDAQTGLQAAAAVGNDTLQRRDRRTFVPDSLTHDAPAARMRWFRRGFDAGSIDSCDTFTPGAVP